MRTRSQTFCKPTSGCPATRPGNTKGFPAIRGSVRTRSSAANPIGMSRAPTLLSGRQRTPRTKSTCSHFKPSASPLRQPDRQRNRMAASPKGSAPFASISASVSPSSSEFVHCGIAAPLRPPQLDPERWVVNAKPASDSESQDAGQQRHAFDRRSGPTSDNRTAPRAGALVTLRPSIGHIEHQALDSRPRHVPQPKMADERPQVPVKPAPVTKQRRRLLARAPLG